jgi:hypothetical protein
MIGIADAMVDEVAADRSAAVGDEAADVAVDEVATTAGPEVIGSGSRRTPPSLMLRWTLRNTISILPRRPEKVEHDEKAWGGKLEGPEADGVLQDRRCLSR